MAIVAPTAPVAPPVAPDRADRATFSARATASFDHLKVHSTPELYALALNAYGNAGEVVTLAGQAATSATNADASADAAAASAATAASAPGTQATSSTPLTVSLGAKSAVIQTGKTISPGQQFVWARTSAPSTRMFTRIDAYNPANGAIDFTVLSLEGSGGPYSDWTVSIGVATPAASRGSGGASIAGNQTLTAGTLAVQTITPTGPGQYVRMPNATTLSAGTPLFDLQNSGAWDLEIQDASGVAIGYVQPGATVGASLRDASTSAGAWALRGHAPYGVAGGDVGFALSLGTVSNSQVRAVVELDTTRELLIYAGDARMYAQVWDNATGTFGTPVLVRAGDIQERVRAVKSATDQVLVFSDDAAVVGSNNLQGVVLSVSGSTITVNTAAVSSVASSPLTIDNLIAVAGQGFVLSYWRTGGNIFELRAVTISGTTVTIGSVLTQSSSSSAAASVFDMGGGRVLWLVPDTNTLFIRPYTVSGSTITLGTAISIAVASAQYMARALASGRVGVIYENNTNFMAGSVVTLTGTVATQSSVALSAATLPNNAIAAAHVVSSQIIAATLTDTPSTSINVLTDNAGTAVAGTEIVHATGQGSPGVMAADTTSITLHLTANSANSGATGRAVQIDINGNSPRVVASRVINTATYATGGFSPSTTTQIFGKDPLPAGMLRGNYGSLSGLAAPITTLWHTPKGLPNVVMAQGVGLSRTTGKTRGPLGNYEWSSATVNTGTLLTVQRTKVA